MEYIKSADDEAGCVFCSAVSGDDVERLVVRRGTHVVALLNKFPYSSGHFMVAPVRHVGDYGELADEEVLELQAHGPTLPSPRRRTPRSWRPAPAPGRRSCGRWTR